MCLTLLNFGDRLPGVTCEEGDLGLRGTLLPTQRGTHRAWLDFLPSGLLGEHGHIRDDEALKLGPLLLPAIIH